MSRTHYISDEPGEVGLGYLVELNLVKLAVERVLLKLPQYVRCFAVHREFYDHKLRGSNRTVRLKMNVA